MYELAIEKLELIGKKELLEQLARLHDKRRDDPRKALAAWERLFVLDETDPRPLDEMDSLATLLSDWSSLASVLAKRAELTNDDEERASLLWRRIGEASCRDMLEDPQGAIDAYERALELEPSSAWTLDNLIPLYEDRNDAARLVDLYRRRIELWRRIRRRPEAPPLARRRQVLRARLSRIAVKRSSSSARRLR